jgi:hypothetical protein
MGQSEFEHGIDGAKRAAKFHPSSPMFEDPETQAPIERNSLVGGLFFLDPGFSLKILHISLARDRDLRSTAVDERSDKPERRDGKGEVGGRTA